MGLLETELGSSMLTVILIMVFLKISRDKLMFCFGNMCLWSLNKTKQSTVTDQNFEVNCQSMDNDNFMLSYPGFKLGPDSREK